MRGFLESLQDKVIIFVKLSWYQHSVENPPKSFLSLDYYAQRARAKSKRQRHKISKLLSNIRRQIFFNDRQACAKGAKFLEPDGTCATNYCCPKTQLEAAKWDLETRGKCWVLRTAKRVSL